MRRALLWPILMLGACGDNLEDDGQFRSGSRLRLAGYAYEDGTRQWQTDTFFDSHLGVECAPRQWSDGATYCTPDVDGTTVFTDAACTFEIARVADDVAPHFVMRTYPLDGTPYPSRLYTAGAAIEPPAEVYELQGTVCAGPFPTPAPYTYHALVEEITHDELVRIRRSEPVAGERLGIVLETSSDGLHVPVALYDRAFETDCTVDPDSAECRPTGAVVASSYFRDPQCSELVLAASGEPPPFAAYVREDNCTTYHRFGDRIAVPPLYVRAGTTCIEAVPRFDELYYEPGPQLALAHVERTARVTAGHRLAPIELEGEGVHVLDTLVHDTALGFDCRYGPYRGQVRCLPQTFADTLHLFTDPSCGMGETVTVAVVSTRACDARPGFVGTPEPFQEANIHPILAPYDAPLYTLTTGDRCIAYVPPEPWLVPHAIGPAIPPEDFAAGAAIVDEP